MGTVTAWLVSPLDPAGCRTQGSPLGSLPLPFLCPLILCTFPGSFVVSGEMDFSHREDTGIGQSDTYGLNLTLALPANAPTSSPQLAPRTNKASIFNIFSE